mmetsp:Transcript_3306/g.13379  ORF Transcript_3306/g.13379 Transcript_3306/m.13379 type:complete len:235 (-) Transcript_3306:2152-2856(-)
MPCARPLPSRTPSSACQSSSSSRSPMSSPLKPSRIILVSAGDSSTSSMRRLPKPASASARASRAPLCALALNTVFLQPWSASTRCSRPVSSRMRTLCRSQGSPQLDRLSPSDKKRQNTQCSVWKTGRCCHTTASRAMAPSPRACATPRSCCALRSCVRHRRSRLPRVSICPALIALAAFSEKSPCSRGMRSAGPAPPSPPLPFSCSVAPAPPSSTSVCKSPAERTRSASGCSRT